MINLPTRPAFATLRKRGNLDAVEIQALLDLCPDPALLVDTRDNHIILANAKATELTALTRAELVDLDLSVLFPTLEEKDFLWKMIGRTRYWDLPMSRHGGSMVDVQVSPIPLDSNKRWIYVTLLPVKIREQQQAEQQRQQQLWQALHALASISQQNEPEAELIQALQAGSVLTGASLLAIYQADTNTLFLRRTAAFGPASLLPERISPHDVTILQTPRLWIAGKPTTCELHRAARASNLVFLASTPLGDANAVIGLAVAANDQNASPENILPAMKVLAGGLTTIIQKHALVSNIQVELQDLKRTLLIRNAIKDTVQEGVILVTPALTILEMNPSAELTLGYASSEVNGQPIENILIGSENLVPSLETAGRSSDLHSLGSFTLYRRDGRAFVAQVRALPLIEDGRLEMLVVLIQDLSQEERFRVRTQQLEQRALLGEVTAVFAHEVRNPINNISTGLQLMALNLPADDLNQEVIGRLQQDCDRLADLMKSVLAFARPVEPNKMELVDLGQMAKRVMERWHPHLSRVNIQHPPPDIDPHTPPIMGEIRSLEQVFTNLISNAVQAMSEVNDGTLTLKVRPAPDDESQVEVSVSDNGPGIPDEIRDHIFEPFFTTKRGGTGLGLSITKQIVTVHKGTIEVKSIPGGTAFQVRFPAAKITRADGDSEN